MAPKAVARMQQKVTPIPEEMYEGISGNELAAALGIIGSSGAAAKPAPRPTVAPFRMRPSA